MSGGVFHAGLGAERIFFLTSSPHGLDGSLDPEGSLVQTPVTFPSSPERARLSSLLEVPTMVLPETYSLQLSSVDHGRGSAKQFPEPFLPTHTNIFYML